ncbi:hypothetical protein FFLO_01957 [Filobasidium floriforme]|uniref:DNA-directed RNA polymerase III subunit RPC4 n=1 Tax=Filobasidium floriforme TaxID=5210 RepID=A0A8K0JNW4_9TREE|nr:hypothetical protein FFLO_01957 [Filobasidium floriforme]
MPPKLGGIGSGFARPAAPGTAAPSNAAAGPSTGAGAGAGTSGTTGGAGAGAPAAPKPKMKFKPILQPTKKVKAEPAAEAVVKTEASGARGPRDGTRGRGRGRGRGAGQAAPSTRPGQEMVASGPFAMPSMSTGRPRVAAAGPDPMAAMHANADRKPTFTAQGESYSDDENDNIIDLEVVPEQSGESAPTGLIRHRSIAAALKEKEGRGKKKSVKAEPGSGQADEQGGSSGVRLRDQPVVVKEEPTSPEKQARELPPTGGRGRDKGKGPATAGRTDDRLTDADMDMDVDINGNRIDQLVEAEKEVVEAKQAIDLDEIVIEDYEEDITGDFVHLEGEADPKDKLYLLQFPDPFPRFIPDPARSFLKDVDLDDLKPKAELSDETAAAGSTATDKTKKGVSFSDKPEEAGGDKAAEAAAKKLAAEEEKEKKAKDAKLRALMKKEEARKPEGRIGTMVVMKSGKVKMVLGDGIVMDVSPGVPTTFVQQLVHMDHHRRNATVLGEVNKNFVMTPDIDRLLDELRMHDGIIPGEEPKVKNEPGIVLQ